MNKEKLSNYLQEKGNKFENKGCLREEAHAREEAPSEEVCTYGGPVSSVPMVVTLKPTFVGGPSGCWVRAMARGTRYPPVSEWQS